jgi:hypothetical protein
VTIPPEEYRARQAASPREREGNSDGREWGLNREHTTTEAAMGISKRTPREAIGTVLVLRLVIIAQLAQHEVDHA